MNLRQRGYLTEMAMVPSLVDLQRKGNKKPATTKELQNARRRALKLKTASDARAAAKQAWEFMEKRQIIQVFIDREAELLNAGRLVPKPVFMNKPKTKWSQVTKNEKEDAIRWLAYTRTELQIVDALKRARQAKKQKRTPDTIARVEVYETAYKEWKKNQKDWRKMANDTRHFFGR